MGTILTIAESFDNGSFDISSDIRTIEAFGFECVPFAVNDCTRLEVASAMNEIFASGQNLPAAVKVGFITSAEVVNGVAERLKRYKVGNIVVDPAIISEDGQIIVTEDVFVSLSNKLFPLAAVLTPNPYEVELLAGMEVHSEEDLVKAGCALSNRYRCAEMNIAGSREAKPRLLNSTRSQLLLLVSFLIARALNRLLSRQVSSYSVLSAMNRTARHPFRSRLLLRKNSKQLSLSNFLSSSRSLSSKLRPCVIWQLKDRQVLCSLLHHLLLQDPELTRISESWSISTTLLRSL